MEPNSFTPHPAGFTFRPGTLDEHAFREVCETNEYRLPAAFRPDDIIVDVGMHIGSFCYAALTRGSTRVHGYEADVSNFERASRHLRPFSGRVTLNHKAVWRSDRPATMLKLFADRAGVNTGAGNVVWGVGDQAVEAIPFDDIIRAVTDNGRERVRLLKIDCEGAEFPILLTSRTLHLIDVVVGEYHEFHGDHDEYPMPEASRVAGFDRFTIDELGAALRAAGLEVTSSRIGDSHMGMFFASRNAAATIPAPHLYPSAGRSWTARARRVLGLSR